MAVADIKTKETNASVDAFLDTIEDEQRRKDCLALAKLLRQVTKATPKMWGSTIVGFGSYRLHYASGRELDFMRVGFAPRKNDLTLYGMIGFDGSEALLQKLGKHKTGKGCLYIKRLTDIDATVLKELVAQAFAHKQTAG